MKDLKELTQSYKEEMIKSLQECIRIKSISGDQGGTTKALNFFLNLAREMGFKVKNVDDLGGIIEYGEGDKSIGIIAHLDVVPEGSGWRYPPFEGQIQDGKIYGRGAMDDKGPSISALYALKAFKESGAKPNCKIQMIIGIDEETVWITTPKLLEQITEPDFSFVPDSKFPIIIAEKGLIWLEINKEFSSLVETDKEKIILIKELRSINESLNIVPDYCEAILQLPADEIITIEQKLKGFLQKETFLKIELDKRDKEIKLISRGKSSHAFSCDEGLNAISQLILFLSELDLAGEQKEFIQTYSHKIKMENFGVSLGLAAEDDLTGKLTINPGIVHMDEKSLTLKVDIRFPASLKLADLKPKVESSFHVFKGNMKIIDSLESLNFPEDDPHIIKLLKVYRDYTGDQEAKPLGMGGTTFAKAFKHAVAFGPSFPGMPKVEHQPDEYMEIDHLMRCAEIYALAINELAT